jgi:hypothetical protein
MTLHVNLVLLVGRVSANGPHLRYAENGTPLCTFVLEIDERSQGKVYTTVLERCFEVLQVLQFIGRILYVDRGHQPRKPLSTSRSTEVCYARHQTDADQGGRR